MKNKRAFATRRLLREGLLRLLEQKKLEKITITELCQESGINRVTFYNHYADPRDILVDLEANMVEELQQLYQLPLSKEAILPCLTDICKYLKENAAVAKVLVQYNTDTELTNFMNDISRRFHMVNELLLTRTSVDEDSARLITTFVGSGSYFLLSQWIMEDIPKTPEEIANLIFSILYNQE